MILISFYYLAIRLLPLSLGANYMVEGSYWIIIKSLIEMAALLVLLVFPISKVYGFDRFFTNVDRYLIRN